MSTNEQAIRVLCYGDSLTWGADPYKDERFASNVRWTGQLQKLLGEKFEIIEEGLCGRTTVLDDPGEDGKNGKTFLAPCIQSHNPIDVVVLMLGSNDLKEVFNLTAQQIANNIEILIEIIKREARSRKNQTPQIVVMSPPLVNEHVKTPMGGMTGAEEKSKNFAMFYSSTAKRQNCEFIDMALYVQPSQADGCHLDIDAQVKIAGGLGEKISSLTK